MLESESSTPMYPDRREFLRLGVGVFAVAASPLAFSRRLAVVRRSVPVMGTIAEFAVVHRNEHRAHGAIDAAVKALEWVERTMTRFTDSSDVGRANAMAHLHPVSVTANTSHVLREGLRWADASEGVFVPCLGKAVVLWDVTQRRSPPAMTAVRRFAGRKLYRSLLLDTWRESPVIRFTAADVAIDLGGIAKGHGVDISVRALRERGIAHALVNVGGDLYALGRSPDGDPWRVGVRSPVDPGQVSATIKLENEAVATSGDYLQFFTHEGRRYHHILDPNTGGPRDSATHSLTVVADTCMTADVAATTAFGMERQAADLLIRRLAPTATIV